MNSILVVCMVYSTRALRLFGKRFPKQPTTSVVVEPTKFCVDCKFCMKIIDDIRFIKCKKFRKINNDEAMEFLVTGVYRENPDKYYFCSTARSDENMCGANGSKFEKY